MQQFKNIIFLMICFFITNQLLAQKNNGVSGYGIFDTKVVNAKHSLDVYLGAGGGVTINDNIMFGVYLRALTEPYKYDYQDQIDLTTNIFGGNEFSKNIHAVSTVINNIEYGISAGINIRPEKTYQFTFTAMTGFSSISFNELSVIEDVNHAGEFYFEKGNYSFVGFNGTLQTSFQLKIGNIFKLGFDGGYHFSHVSGNIDTNLDIGNVFRSPMMFSGFYGGGSLTFGSF